MASGGGSQEETEHLPRKRQRIDSSSTDEKNEIEDESFLPANVLSRIFAKIPESDLLKEVQFVSKRWYRIVNTSSSCWTEKRFKLDTLLTGRNRSRASEYEYMRHYLSRYGRYLRKLTISLNGRTINREQTLQFINNMQQLIDDSNAKFYCLKCLSLSNLRLERRAWDDRRAEMIEVYAKLLDKHVPRRLERLHMNDVLVKPAVAARLLDILSARFYGLRELDIEELISSREPDRELDQIIIEDGQTGEFVSQPGESERIEREVVEFREARDIIVPDSLARFLMKAKNLRKIIVNYNYLTETLFERLLTKSNDNHFGQNLIDFHIRIDHNRCRLLDAFDHTGNSPSHPNPPTLRQFSEMSHKFPRIRFSLSFEKEMRYQKHVKILGGEAEQLNFRLHRLELRGDAFTDTNGMEPSISQTLTKILPRYGENLSKLVINWYSPLEYLNEEIFKVVKASKNLSVLRLKLFMDFEVVCKLLNLVRFCEDLDHEVMSEFEDFPDCVPMDMTNLPRNLKVLKITRCCYHENDFGEGEDDPDWAEWRENNHIETEYTIAVERLMALGDFQYERKVCY